MYVLILPEQMRCCFDTLGLTPIGLPVCSATVKSGTKPGSCFMRNLAAYLFEYGDVIEERNTVEGIHHENGFAGKKMPLSVHAGCPGYTYG